MNESEKVVGHIKSLDQSKAVSKLFKDTGRVPSDAKVVFVPGSEGGYNPVVRPMDAEDYNDKPED